MLGTVFCGHHHPVAHTHTRLAQLGFEQVNLLGHLGQRHHPLRQIQKGVLRGLCDAFIKQLMNARVR